MIFSYLFIAFIIYN